MTNKVQIDLDARDAQAVQAWQRAKASIGDFNAQLDQMDGKQRKNAGSARSVMQGLQGVASSIIGISSGYQLVTKGVEIWRQANDEIIRQAEETGRIYDDIFRKFRVQSGLAGLQATAAQERILDLAEKNAVEEQEAGAAVTQLVSSGFAPDDAAGAAGDAFLQIMAATNQTDKQVDRAGMAKVLSQFLGGTGKDLTSENLLDTGVKIQRLFKGTNLQLSTAGALAKEAGAVKGALSEEELLASGAALSKTFDDATLSTGIRNIVGRLRTAAASKEKVAALGQLGLKPEDVDFVGENLDEVLGRLQTGLAGVSKEQEAPILKKLFEEAGVAVATNLIENRENIQSFIGLQGDRQGFAADVAVAQSGRNAAALRQQIRERRRRAAEDQQGDLVRAAAIEQAELAADAGGESGLGFLLRVAGGVGGALLPQKGVERTATALRGKGASALQSLGVAPETAAQAVLADLPGAAGRAQASLQADLGPPADLAGVVAAAMEQNNALMVEQNQLLHKQAQQPQIPVKPVVANNGRVE
jgi:hypothetical protein